MKKKKFLPSLCKTKHKIANLLFEDFADESPNHRNNENRKQQTHKSEGSS
ncbi:Uncharacterized protein APZ42_011407 [Daphnia magna]|uniref:Uncharacterized protein n=1 Tax=Daphnia magna TaxID=35525 RepID=A0A162SM85_9CRUS|nr:Uncharacterized protein APZ42_011407 [Daphnia magna]